MLDIKENIMFQDEASELCMYCGLCCMGYFHESAIINDNNDLMLVKKMGARSLMNKSGTQFFELPCPKFDNKCTVYPERPSVCENHQCELLKSVKAEKISLEKGKNLSDEMKKLCILLDQELDTLLPYKATHCLTTRFKSLFLSEDIVKKKNPHLFLNYASYVVLKNRYFYHDATAHMQKID